MTLKEQIMKLQTYKMYEGEDTVYVERDDVLKALEQQPNRCDSCVHSEEQDGSNCYECVKGMTDNFETQPTDADCISREEVDNYIVKLMSGYLYDEERARLEDLTAYIWELPSVTPTRPNGKWKRISPAGIYECTNCNQVIMTSDIDCYKFCHGCGVRMEGKE